VDDLGRVLGRPSAARSRPSGPYVEFYKMIWKFDTYVSVSSHRVVFTVMFTSQNVCRELAVSEFSGSIQQELDNFFAFYK
jgi:hypothetical protein